MLLAVSVDLDETHLYNALHGLRPINESTLVYTRALPRLSDWARQRGIPLTWFAVGKDVETKVNRELISRLASGGDEVGCHTHSHQYDLTRRPVREIQHEITEGACAIERAAGAKPKGFRAPGYVVTDTLLDLLRESGFRYDSSIFPCPAYYSLKLAALARIKASGKRSAAIVGAPEALRAPTAPYRVGRPYWFRGAGIWEIPIQVTRRAKLPFIGTALTMAGAAGARLLARGVLGLPFVNLELHGIDALDERDGLEDLAPFQRDLRTPWAKKLESISAAIEFLRSKGYASVRMDELAARAARG